MAEPARAKPLLPKANKLSWFQSTYAGVDVLLDPDSRRDYQLTNVRGIFGPLMSEYVFGHLLSLMRQIPFIGSSRNSGCGRVTPIRASRGAPC